MNAARREDAHRLSFRRAVWLLQRAQPDAVPVGHQGPASREAIRFRPSLGLGFPATEVCDIEERAEGAPGPRYVLETNFLGLYGSQSPLPASYTEDLIEDPDEALNRGFLDLFNHRVISLFHRAMEKYRFSWQFTWAGDDQISRRLQLLCGVPREALPKKTSLSPVRLLAFASVLRRGGLSASSLLAVLREYLSDVEVRLEQCVPQWIGIPAAQQSELGKSYCSLGKDACLGQRVEDRANTFRVSLGPLSETRFMEFLPGAPRMNELCELLDLLNRDQLDYEVELILDPEEDPELRLGSSHAALGWSTWLMRPEGAEQGRGPRVSFLFQDWFHE